MASKLRNPKQPKVSPQLVRSKYALDGSRPIGITDNLNNLNKLFKAARQARMDRRGYRVPHTRRPFAVERRAISSLPMMLSGGPLLGSIFNALFGGGR